LEFFGNIFIIGLVRKSEEEEHTAQQKKKKLKKVGSKKGSVRLFIGAHKL